MTTDPTTAALLRDCLGTMQAMRSQIDQMSGMFPDEDGTIAEACSAHDEMDERVRSYLDGKPTPAFNAGANYSVPPIPPDGVSEEYWNHVFSTDRRP